MTKVPEYFPFDETRTQITSELLYLRMMPKSVHCKNVKMTTIIQSTADLYIYIVYSSHSAVGKRVGLANFERAG